MLILKHSFDIITDLGAVAGILDEVVRRIEVEIFSASRIVLAKRQSRNFMLRAVFRASDLRFEGVVGAE